MCMRMNTGKLDVFHRYILVSSSSNTDDLRGLCFHRHAGLNVTDPKTLKPSSRNPDYGDTVHHRMVMLFILGLQGMWHALARSFSFEASCKAEALIQACSTKELRQTVICYRYTIPGYSSIRFWES